MPRVWVTEGIHPGIVACSHHTGPRHLHPDSGGQCAASAHVDLVRKDSTFLLRQKSGAASYHSTDPDTERIWWKEVGDNQNLAFPVQPDPISGMHCWHQKVKVAPGQSQDHFGDVFVDTKLSRQVYEEWLQRAHPAPGPGGLRRPLWFNRPLHPRESAYKMDDV